MTFEWLNYLKQENQFDEIQIIGRTVEVQGKYLYLLAMTRKGETARLSVLVQTDPDLWQEEQAECKTMRSSMKQHTMDADTGIAAYMEAVTVGDTVLELSGATSYNMGMNHDVLVYLLQIMQAGWQLPEDHPFMEMDWEQIQFIQYECRHPFRQLLDCGQEPMVLRWGTGSREYLIEKRVLLTIAQEEQDIRNDKQISFTLTDKKGQARDGICYINRVTLMDPWKDLEEMWAMPEYQTRALEHMTLEELEQMKEETAKLLERKCPRGMRCPLVEYECTLDVSLSFYSSAYLKSKPTVSGTSASFLVIHPKPDNTHGTHGLPLKVCLMEDALPKETVQIRAELFQAYERTAGLEVQCPPDVSCAHLFTESK